MMNVTQRLQHLYQTAIYPYDLRMLLWFVRTRHRQWWVFFARTLSRTGDGFMQFLLPLFLWMLDRESGGSFLVATASAFAIERPLYWLLKNGCQRRRPPETIPSFCSVIKAYDRFSFPSGHTGSAFLLAAMIAAHYGILAAPVYLWAGAVGLSRVVLGVHFPSDILAGALIGGVIASIVNTYWWTGMI